MGHSGAHSASPYIDNTAQCSNSIGSEDNICATTGVFHNRAGNHDGVISGAGQLLDDKVYHLPQAGIFVLEELRDTEEESGGFVCRELLARI